MSGKGRASETGIERIRAAMKRNGWTQAETAQESGFSRSTLNQILAGQSVKLENIEELCHLFDLEVGQVVAQEVVGDLDRIIEQLRSASEASLRLRCGTMRILDMTQPVDTGAIYTDVNILEKVAGKTRREIQELMAECGVEEFDRFFLGGVQQKWVPGFEAVLQKKLLMILGRPGAGKTTFLKRLAIECLNGTFLGDRLPVFVTLKEFAETERKPGMLEFIGGDRASLIQVLAAGKALVLFDGLDEVMERDHDRVIREIREFAETYNENHIVITCRIAAREYIFEQFTEVEIADFDDDQICIFADKWFKTKEGNPKSKTGEMFWKELQSRKPVKELATNPLLLTLLCLEFDNSSVFPQSRLELYECALNVLLSKWDGQKRIRRDEVYQGLSRKRKETMLGQLAIFTFSRGDYFFKERTAVQQIEQYVRNFPGTSDNLSDLEVDSQAVLKSIESQHGLLAERAKGVYSFSHLTFQEYFTARNILDLSNSDARHKQMKMLIDNMGDKRWKEVTLLVVEGLDNADDLLRSMKSKTDSILDQELELQEFLKWINAKSDSIKAIQNTVATRAFYLDFAIGLDRALSRILARILKFEIKLEIDLDLALDLTLASALDRAYARAYPPSQTFDPAGARALSRLLLRTLSRVLALTADSNLKDRVQNIYNRLPDISNCGRFSKWWQQNGKEWTEDLRQIMIEYRNIGHDWQFTDDQKKKLQQYYDANLLLAECLNSECYLSREVREEIESRMIRKN